MLTFHGTRIFILILLCFAAVTVSFVVDVKASPTTWITETVDASADVGHWSSVAIDSDGFPHIAYYDGYWENLKYATPSRVPGPDWVIMPVDTPGYVGPYPSIALDSNNNPHISYLDVDNDSLKYAKWVTGPTWTIETVDSTGTVGAFSSLALDSNGFPHISYIDTRGFSDHVLKYARWNGVFWVIETVDSTIDVGGFSSLALDSNDNPHISYCDASNWQLRYAYWSEGIWIIETGIDSAGASHVNSFYNSLALDSEDRPHISYYQRGTSEYILKYIYWTGTTWTNDTVDASVGWDMGVSLALDWLDRPHISYCDGDMDQLRYARWFGGEWIIEAIDLATAVRVAPSLALDSEGKPHISYQDLTNDNLKYASTSDEYFAGVSVTPFDSDSDGLNDAVEIYMDADTSTSGTIEVHTSAFLVDPSSYHADYNSTSWEITGQWGEWIPSYLYVPAGYAEGPAMYSVELTLFDDGDFIEDFYHETDIYLYPASTPSPAPLIESCNSTGAQKDVFELGETVYATGGGFFPLTSYPFYLVEDLEAWTDGMTIPERVPGTEPSIVSNEDGEIDPSDMWHDPQIMGGFDMVVDVNRNGQYDEGIDALDGDDIELVAGFIIIPELSTILPAFMIATLSVAILLRRKHAHKTRARPRF